MRQEKLWIEEKKPGYLLHKELLAAGEKPDMRPWGGKFDTLDKGENRELDRLEDR